MFKCHSNPGTGQRVLETGRGIKGEGRIVFLVLSFVSGTGLIAHGKGRGTKGTDYFIVIMLIVLEAVVSAVVILVHIISLFYSSVAGTDLRVPEKRNETGEKRGRVVISPSSPPSPLSSPS